MRAETVAASRKGDDPWRRVSARRARFTDAPLLPPDVSPTRRKAKEIACTASSARGYGGQNSA